MRIGIKVGSSLVIKKTSDGTNVIDQEFLLGLCEDIYKIRGELHDVFLVSSGAIRSDNDTSHSDALRAAIGQPRLMSVYSSLAVIYEISVAQVLVVAEEFKINRDHIKSVLAEAMDFGILPIINANDVVNDEESNRLKELDDNDRLFKEVCLMMEVDRAYIYTSTDGLLDKSGKTVQMIKPDTFDSALDLAQGGNEFGHGNEGMKTKLLVARELAENGITTEISNGRFFTRKGTVFHKDDWRQ